MDITIMTEFFKWCSIINIIILAIGSVVIMTSDLAYNVHTKLGVWEGSKDAYKQTMYLLLGKYKILIFIFNVVPYFALLCCM